MSGKNQHVVPHEGDWADMLGWAPRYLVKDFVGAMVEFTELSATVIRSNPQDAPLFSLKSTKPAPGAGFRADS